MDGLKLGFNEIDGESVGDDDGNNDGLKLGMKDGSAEGSNEGSFEVEGSTEGTAEGCCVRMKYSTALYAWTKPVPYTLSFSLSSSRFLLPDISLISIVLCSIAFRIATLDFSG